jgi:hypothetical protein
MGRWDRGEVQAHVGPVHRVETAFGTYWCESDDLLVDSPRREELLVPGARIWGLWLDGRWYSGAVDGVQGPLRHVAWDDGDRMWIEARNLVLLSVEPPPPQVGRRVLAPRWDGGYEPGTVEQVEGEKFRVVFADGEDVCLAAEDLQTFPPCPFLDGPLPGGPPGQGGGA